MSDAPLAYLITFRTYGTWLHGDDRGSTDRDHRAYDTPFVQPDIERRNIAHSRLTSPPVTLNPDQRRVVTAAIRQQCDYRGWALAAINARTEHVHIVVSSALAPERIMNTFKAYATRELRRSGQWAHATSPWSRHGSTRYLRSDESVARAVVYVNERQNAPKVVLE